MFSDELIGLNMRHNREQRRTVATAQGIIDEQADHVARLHAKLRAAYAELELEQGRRRAAELKVARLNAILDMPLN